MLKDSDYQKIKRAALRKLNNKPKCGEDFCDVCGNCLECYSGDNCYDGGLCHWIVYADPLTLEQIRIIEAEVYKESGHEIKAKEYFPECWCF